MGFDCRKLLFGFLILAFGLGLRGTAQATPYLVVNAKTGEVIAQQDATEPWYPASLTKLVSVYVALKAVREKRLTFNTPFVVSKRAASMPPSKMGFAPGTELTLDNLLKMLLVKSANDLAVTLAEGIDGSVEDFAAEMNATAASLGMSESHFVNPNGLQDPNHYSSARDLAIVARALYRDFPEDAGLFDIGALKLGKRVIPTLNGLLGRFPGVDGMKTGFTCPAGFNIVVSATQGDRKIIAVVLGYPNARARTLRAAALLEMGFHSQGTGVKLTALPASPITTPPNMREAVCGRHREKVAQKDFPIEIPAPAAGGTLANDDDDSPARFFAPPAIKTVSASKLLFSGPRPVFKPVPVFLGPVPGWNGPVLQARAAPETPPGATLPAGATAFAPTIPAARGSNSAVGVGRTASGASAKRAIAEKALAHGSHAKSRTRVPASKVHRAARLRHYTPHRRHAHSHVRRASATARVARRRYRAKPLAITPSAGRRTSATSTP